MVTSVEPEVCDEERPGPESAQDSTLVALHEIRELLPLRTRLGLADSERSGTRTVSVRYVCPPLEQMTPYSVVSWDDTETEPDGAPPVEKLNPELEDELTQDHEMSAVSPTLMVDGERLIDGVAGA